MGWLRKISLSFYVDGVHYRTYTSDGTRNTLQISFEVEKTSVGTPNESNIILTNASPDTKGVLLSLMNKQQITVELFAGYEDEGMTLVSQGNLIKLFPEKQGSIDTFALTFLDAGSAITNSHLEMTFSKNAPLSIVVYELAKSFQKNDVKVDLTKINLEGTIGKRPYTVSGRTATILDQLAENYRFTWSIQDGVFQAYMDDKNQKKASQAVYKISLKERNLLKATPEIGEKYMQQTGMKIEAILNPKCKCMDIIDLESTVYPQYNGYYEIHTLSMKGGTKEADWKMIIDSKSINDGLNTSSNYVRKYYQKYQEQMQESGLWI